MGRRGGGVISMGLCSFFFFKQRAIFWITVDISSSNFAYNYAGPGLSSGGPSVLFSEPLTRNYTILKIPRRFVCRNIDWTVVTRSVLSFSCSCQS
jgi:hypothetical protein